MTEKPYKQESVKTRSRPGKVANQPIARTETYSASVGAFLSKRRITFPVMIADTSFNVASLSSFRRKCTTLCGQPIVFCRKIWYYDNSDSVP